ncbi:hypothetical protein Afil01_57590 [Actinorhabdospora filicis]|uniref:Uncharacterized protein n=1 Tax=Actinorhabdospora filicis TaxID=1785913 RepID=A0A9W6SRL2_9ACTN|nr:hypothetical protein [Actinorhabdospora filicis]GLZ80952.1 hypothetical protein Afil01_57590 [Actinorhabdospora filicis]
MTAWQDSGYPLKAHDGSPHPVRVGVGPDAVLLPSGAAGLWIDTGSGAVPPVVGVDDAPAVCGWGRALIAVPPGRHLIAVQLQGTSECERLADLAEGEVTAWEYRESRFGGRGVLGPPGVRPGGLSGSRLLAAILLVQAVAIGAAAVLGRYGGWLSAIFGWILCTVLAAWLVSLPVRARGRATTRRQSGPPAERAPGVHLLAPLRGPELPALAAGEGRLLLAVSTESGPDAPADGWREAPEVTVDGERVPLANGRWCLSLPAGTHWLEAFADGRRLDLGVRVIEGRTTGYELTQRSGEDGTVLAAHLERRFSPPGSTPAGVDGIASTSDEGY